MVLNHKDPTATLRRVVNLFAINEQMDYYSWPRFELVCTMAEVARLRAFTLCDTPGKIVQDPLGEFLAGSTFKFDDLLSKDIKICLPVCDIDVVTSSHRIATSEGSSTKYGPTPATPISSKLSDLTDESGQKVGPKDCFDISSPMALIQGGSAQSGAAFIVFKGTF